MDEIKIYSTVCPQLKKHLFARALFFGSLGALLLLCAGAFAPLSLIQSWGLFIFCFGISCIAYGLIPYKQLTSLESSPHTLIIREAIWVFVHSKGGVNRFDVSHIQHAKFISKKRKYGLIIRQVNGKSTYLPYLRSDPRLDEIMHPEKADKLA